MKLIGTAPLLFALSACGTSASTTTTTPTSTVNEQSGAEIADVPAETINYYQGTSTTTSPDGSTPYGPPAAVLVRRHVDPAAGIIEESVINNGQAFPTTLTWTQGTEFSASDEGATFRGTVTFSGPEWAWTSWTYDIAMSDGSGTLRGNGSLSADGIHTEKMFHAPDGSAQARIVEALIPIDEATYDELRSATSPSE